MKTRQQRQAQLAHLFRQQDGKCHVCGETARLDGANDGLSAVRFRTGSSFGTPGRVRPRVMAHRKCAQERSDQIQMSQDVDDLRHRSGRHPTEFYTATSTDVLQNRGTQ
jgi:hypothetical protein